MNKKPKTIVTHDKTFHTDEIFAVAVICLILDLENSEYQIIRTRDKQIIKDADYVVDVGKVYEPENNLFDHHQLEGAGFHYNGIPYASFGIVWKKFGLQLCNDDKAVYDHVVKDLVLGVDAVDNGVRNPYTQRKYSQYNIQAIVAAFRPAWNEDFDRDIAFGELVDFVKKLLQREIVRSKSDQEAVLFIREEYKSAGIKKYLVLNITMSRTSIYSALGVAASPDVLYVLFPSKGADKKEGRWNIIAVRKEGSKDLRKPLPPTWRGYDDEKLASISGVTDALFCHKSGFMAAANSYNGVVEMLQSALGF